MAFGTSFIPSICPGYSTALPEVRRVATSWAWWDKGQLKVRVEEPDDLFLDLIELFNGQLNSAQAYEMKEREKRAKEHR